MTLRTPEEDAIQSVARETDGHIIGPAYTRAALWQMGMRRSYGASDFYRERFAAAFVDAWVERYEQLTGKAVL